MSLNWPWIGVFILLCIVRRILGLQNLTISTNIWVSPVYWFDSHLRRTLSHVTSRDPPEEGDDVLARLQTTSLDAVRIHEPFRDSVQPIFNQGKYVSLSTLEDCFGRQLTKLHLLGNLLRLRVLLNIIYLVFSSGSFDTSSFSSSFRQDNFLM